MKMKAKTSLLTLIAATALQCVQAQAHDGPGARRSCDVSTLRGLYLLKGSGFALVNGTATAKAILGTIRFNGDGTMVIENLTVTILGLPPIKGDGVATYTVESDCTGTVTVPNGPAWNIYVSSPVFVSQIQTGGPDRGVIQADARFISR
jgi:hypothetical protein